jgi:hypothetical protein
MTKNETFSGRREFPIAGHYFELLSTVSVVDLEFFDSDGRMIANELQVEEGYFVDRRGVRPFARFAIVTGASEAVKFLVTDGFSGQRSALADVTDRAARLLGIATIDTADTLTNPAAVTVGVAEVAVLAAAAARKLAVFHAPLANTGDIYLGPTGVTTLIGALKLAPGDTYIEDIAAAAAWFGIATAAAQSLRVLHAA